MILEKEQEYRSHKNYNYSALSALATSPGLYKYKRDNKQTGQALDNGTAVDILVQPGGLELFNEVFIVPTVIRPSGQLGDYIDHYFRLGDEETAYELAGFKRDGLAKVTERFVNEGREYYNFLKDSADKVVLPLEEYQKIERAVNTLKSNKYTSKFFSNDDENIEIQYQVPVYFNFSGFDYKILIDIVYINHYDKSISIYDLKTTSKGVYSFQKSFMDYRYYLQNSLYSEGLKALKISLGLEGYIGMPLKFIVQEIDGYNQPVVYDYKRWRDFGRDGGIYKGERYKGFVELSQELKWHTENDLWEYPMDIYLNEGERIVEYERGTTEVQ